MAIYLVRPGQTDFDVQHRLQGAIDLPLTEQGNQEVNALVDEVRNSRIDRIYSSPSEPALSTAKRIADQLALPLKVLKTLENVDLGLWQGLCVKEVRSKQPRVFKQWEDSPSTVCPPQGEDGKEACERVAEALRKPLKKGGSFAIVAPEPLASLIQCHIEGRQPEISESLDSQQRPVLCQQIGLKTET